MRKWLLSILVLTTLAYSDDMKQRAEETYKQYKLNEHIEKQWEKMIDYDPQTGKFKINGQVDYRSNPNLKAKEDNRIVVGVGDNEYLGKDDRIYIFVSSSIPKQVIDTYIEQVVAKRLNNRTVFVLRGCIGGCTYIKPTLNYLQGLIKNRSVEFWIDPFLFRRYNIDKVPCVVFAEGVDLIDYTLSEGLNDNIKQVKGVYKSCGDWNLTYHLQQIYRQSNSKKIKEIIR